MRTDPDVPEPEWNALLRLSHNDEVIFEGEIRPAHSAQLPDGWKLEVLWIRHHRWNGHDARK